MSWLKIVITATKYLSILAAGYEVNELFGGFNPKQDESNKFALVVSKLEDALKIKEADREMFEQETKYVLWGILGLVLFGILISAAMKYIATIREDAQKEMKRDLQQV